MPAVTARPAYGKTVLQQSTIAARLPFATITMDIGINNNWSVQRGLVKNERAPSAARYSHGNITGKVVQAYLRAARATKTVARYFSSWTLIPSRVFPGVPVGFSGETFFRDVAGNRESNLLYAGTIFTARRTARRRQTLIAESPLFACSEGETGKVAFVE